MIRAAKMDTVKVHYTGRLADGTIFDRSPEDRPLRFIIGKGEVIPGFDAAVEGMYQGETKTVTIPPDQAYGPSEPQLIEQVERALLPEDLDLRVGAQLEVTQQDGRVVRLMVRDISAETVTLDANHPLAGQELIFDITLELVTKGAAAFPPAGERK